MYLLMGTSRKLRCMFFVFLLSEVLDNVTGTPKDVLMGYMKSPPMVGIPYFVVSSVDMTASICCDICYMNKTTYAVILDQNCTCTSNLLDNTVSTCQVGRPCPGNSTESCGCDDNNYAIVYNYGTLYTYTVYITTSAAIDKSATGFKGDIYLNAFGPDGRECREAAAFGVNWPGVGIKNSITITCRDLKGFAMVRLGHSNKNNAWTVDKVSVDDPSTKQTTTYSFSKCGPIYLSDKTGNGTMAEFRANSTCGYPVKGDNYFSPEENTLMNVIVCSSGFSDVECSGDDVTANEYIAFSRYFHKHVFPLAGLVYLEKNDCDNISVAVPNVIQTGRFGSVVGSSYLFNCTNGYFVSANNTRTRTIQPVCQATGLWSVDSMPECIPACFGKMPGSSSVNISSTVTNQSVAIAGDTIVYTCKNGVFDGFDQPCNRLEIICLASGNWSQMSIPNCTPTTSGLSSITGDGSNEVTCPNGGRY